MTRSLPHVIAVYLVILSSFVNQLHCQIIGLKLQTSSMPIGGNSWATYYQSALNKIWLLSPRRWNPVILMHNYPPSIISYDIDNDIFELHPNISNVKPSMNGWVPRYSVAIGNEIYFHGDTGAINVYNINTDTTTYIHTINGRQACLATDGRFIFFMGGERVDGTSGVADTAAYDTNTDIWYYGNNQLYYLRRFPCEIINGVIYTFGGNNGWSRDYISKLNVGTGTDIINNYKNNNWEAAGNLLISRSYHNTAICNSLDTNLIYIIGGSHSSDAGGTYKELDIEIYDINTETTQFASFVLNKERVNPAVLCIDRHIYIFGGSGSGSSNSWEKSQLTQSPTNMPTKEPSVEPTIKPTSKTDEPTNIPSLSPVKPLTLHPSNVPSSSPTQSLTLHPSNIPSLSPIQHHSIPQINAILPSDSTKSPLFPSYSSTVFVSTEDRNNSVEKEPNKVDVVIVVFSIIIVVASIAIVIFLYRLLKLRKQAAENNNKMAQNSAKTKDDDDDDVITRNELEVTNYAVNAERGEDNDLDNNDADEDEDDDIILEGIQKTAGDKEQDTTDLINNDEFIIRGDDEITPKGNTAY